MNKSNLRSVLHSHAECEIKPDFNSDSARFRYVPMFIMHKKIH